jgi:hypothetical protein
MKMVVLEGHTTAVHLVNNINDNPLA